MEGREEGINSAAAARRPFCPVVEGTQSSVGAIAGSTWAKRQRGPCVHFPWVKNLQGGIVKQSLGI